MSFFPNNSNEIKYIYNIKINKPSLLGSTSEFGSNVILYDNSKQPPVN